jgi:hypothetical protein
VNLSARKQLSVPKMKPLLSSVPQPSGFDRGNNDKRLVTTHRLGWLQGCDVLELAGARRRDTQSTLHAV